MKHEVCYRLHFSLYTSTFTLYPAPVPGTEPLPLRMFGHVKKHAEDQEGDQCEHDVEENSPDQG